MPPEFTEKEMDFVLVGLERLRAYCSTRSEDESAPVSESLRFQEDISQIDALNNKLRNAASPEVALDIMATYSHGTNRFWVYEHQSDEGIFKFWIPHTKRIAGTSTYKSQRPPKTMSIHVEFERGK